MECGHEICHEKRWAVAFAVRLGCFVLLMAAAAAQGAPAPEPAPTEMPPAELVRLAVENEVAAAKDTSVKHMFRSRKQTPRGSQTHLYVETDDAMAGELIAINDQPLTPEQRQGEVNHLAWLMNNPDQLRRKSAREKEDADRTLEIVKALPKAFRYRYEGTVNGTADQGKAGDELVRLSFTPDPSYSPPTRVEAALTAMQGYVLIDPVARRLALIDGTLFKDVTFGWGIFGWLDKGGHFRVRQADVGDGSWQITEMSLNIKGKILLFKTLTMVWDEVISDFRRTPEKLTFAQGVEMLKSEGKNAVSTSALPKPQSPH
jgi:hypothetical protein